MLKVILYTHVPNRYSEVLYLVPILKPQITKAKRTSTNIQKTCPIHFQTPISNFTYIQKIPLLLSSHSESIPLSNFFCLNLMLRVVAHMYPWEPNSLQKL